MEKKKLINSFMHSISLDVFNESPGRAACGNKSVVVNKSENNQSKGC